MAKQEKIECTNCGKKFVPQENQSTNCTLCGDGPLCVECKDEHEAECGEEDEYDEEEEGTLEEDDQREDDDDE